LGVKPKIILTKRRNATTNWGVASTLWADKKQLVLNEADALSSTNNNLGIQSNWTETVFTVGTEGDQNADGGTYVSYVFADVEGYSKVGSYTGNGQSGDGAPFVHTGFRPAWILFKNVSASESWQLIDNTRSPYNVANAVLFPNSAAAEVNPLTAANTDFLSNGFKIRAASGNTNDNGLTYIYLAFAEQTSIKYANAR